MNGCKFRTLILNRWNIDVFKLSRGAISSDKVQIRVFFTLIELLIVMAMMAILIALLFPALRKASGTARTIYCASNQKELGIAAMELMEIQKNKGKHGLEWQLWWRFVLDPYFGNNNYPFKYCPEAPAYAGIGDHFGTVNEGYRWSGVAASYTINVWSTWNYHPNRMDVQVTDSRYIGNRGSSKNPILLDGLWVDTRPSNNYIGVISVINIWRHNLGVNVLFHDGHVENVFERELNKLEWHK